MAAANPPTGAGGSDSSTTENKTSGAETPDEPGSGCQTEEEDKPAADEQGQRTILGLRWLILCGSLYLTCFLYGLDTTIAADLQGPIVEAFGRVDQLSWVGVGFPLGSVAVILPIGALFSSFDLKWTFIALVGIFEVGSVVCGAAPNMNALIVGRVVAGVGGSGIYLGSLNYLSSMTSPRERGFYISLTGFSWGVGCVLGPIIGGLFADSAATWRWGFYINLVIGGLTLPAMWAYLPNLCATQGISVGRRLESLDFAGFLLGAATWALFTVAFTIAGAQWAWSDGRTIGLIVVFGVVAAAYVAQQTLPVLTTKETRSFPVDLLRSRTQVLLYIATSANITVLFVVIYYIPIYFQFTKDDSALMAAVRLLPFVVVTVVFNVAAGHLLPRVQYYMPVYLVSGLLLTLGSGLLVGYWAPETPQSYIYAFSVIIATGTGLTLQAGYSVASFRAPAAMMGGAISVQNISQIGSTVISLVIAGQVYQSTAFGLLSDVLGERGFEEAEIRDALSGARSAVFARLEGEVRVQAVAAITEAMRRSLILAVVGGGVLTLAAALMRVERMMEEREERGAAA